MGSRIVLAVLTLLACGCTTATYTTDASLGLTKDRYVLPPEPEPPSPRTFDELRALEAEWPPVTAADPTIRQVRPYYAPSGPLPECGTPQAEGRA